VKDNSFVSVLINKQLTGFTEEHNFDTF